MKKLDLTRNANNIAATGGQNTLCSSTAAPAYAGLNNKRVVKTLREAEKFLDWGYDPWVYIQGKSFGRMTEWGFVLDWAAGSEDEEFIPNKWNEHYLIHRDDKESWNRLAKVIALCREDSDYEYNNWWDLADAIKSGTYMAEYTNNGEPWYHLTNAVMTVVKDLTPTWEEVIEMAYANDPTLKDKEYPNTWDGFHEACEDVIEASKLW